MLVFVTSSADAELANAVKTAAIIRLFMMSLHNATNGADALERYVDDVMLGAPAS
jgi:hypothetical protein